MRLSQAENISSVTMRSRYPALPLSFKAKYLGTTGGDDHGYTDSGEKPLSRKGSWLSAASEASETSQTSDGCAYVADGISSILNHTSQQSSERFPATQSRQKPFHRRVIVLNDPPLVDDRYDRNTLRTRIDVQDSVLEFITAVQCPVVIVLSQVSGRDDVQHMLDRCIPQKIKQM